MTQYISLYIVRLRVIQLSVLRPNVVVPFKVNQSVHLVGDSQRENGLVR